MRARASYTVEMINHLTQEAEQDNKMGKKLVNEAGNFISDGSRAFGMLVEAQDAMADSMSRLQQQIDR